MQEKLVVRSIEIWSTWISLDQSIPIGSRFRNMFGLVYLYREGPSLAMHLVLSAGSN